MVSWEREPLEDYELRELLNAATDTGDVKKELAAHTLAYTGMRAGEYAHMTDDWFKGQRDRVEVPRHEPCDCGDCQQRAGEIAEQGDETFEQVLSERWRPKTDESVRNIPVRDQYTRKLLRNYFAAHDAIGLSRMTVYRYVRDVAEQTEISKKVTPHVLRHTYGTRLAAMDFTASAIQSAMGHADLETSQKYIQYSGRRLDEEFDRKWEGV